jgi:hypothetical protein
MSSYQSILQVKQGLVAGASAFGIQVETEMAIRGQFSNSLQALNPPSNLSGV